jgi:Na+/melibiose symporter-like transporter
MGLILFCLFLLSLRASAQALENSTGIIMLTSECQRSNKTHHHRLVEILSTLLVSSPLIFRKSVFFLWFSLFSVKNISFFFECVSVSNV